jgi:RES domain-containing protein
MFTLFQIPEDKIFVCEEAQLPGNWKQLAHTQECRDFGTKLLQRHLIVRVPSVVLPYEYNYLVSPAHPNFPQLVSLAGTEDYAYDLRIKQ